MLIIKGSMSSFGFVNKALKTPFGRNGYGMGSSLPHVNDVHKMCGSCAIRQGPKQGNVLAWAGWAGDMRIWQVAEAYNADLLDGSTAWAELPRCQGTECCRQAQTKLVGMK